MTSIKNFIRNVKVFDVSENGDNVPKFVDPLVDIKLEYHPQGVALLFFNSPNGEKLPFECLVEKSSPPLRLGRAAFIVSTESAGNMLFRIQDENDATNFYIGTTKALKGNETSVFSERTEDSSALQYFQFYGYLSQQQNMMQDYIRTATYQRAILANPKDFAGKVVLDVGAGSGILSFFAIQAGAKKVYAVEASSMAMHAETLANSNGYQGKLIVLPGKIEEIELSEPVDTIISEPMGYMLYNERMLETFLHAKKWLRPDGKMFPTKGDLHIAPFTDDALFLEQCNKANFWLQDCFHGVNLSSLKGAALKEYFRQPIVDTFDVRICLAKSVKHTVDFQTASEFDLHRIEIPLEFQMLESGMVHGLAFWFDVSFDGSSHTIWLSTAPTEPLTHWYQVRCLVETPILAAQGQILKGQALLIANKRQSYDVQIDLELNGQKATNTLDLKNPYFRYTGQQPQPPPGQHTTAPSDNIWTTLETTTIQTPQAGTQVNGVAGVVNGIDAVNLVNMANVFPTNQTTTNSGHYAPTGLIPLTEFQLAAGNSQITTGTPVVTLKQQSGTAQSSNDCFVIKPCGTFRPW